MISQIAELLGDDERALRIARMLLQVVMWLRPLEILQVAARIDAAVDRAVRVRRAA